MQRKSHDRLFVLVLLLLAPAICYWVSARYGFADAPLGLQNCNNCPCKDVTAWQVDGDDPKEAHGFRQSPNQKPYSWTAVGTSRLNISTIPNSCSNYTGDVTTLGKPNTIYGPFQYSEASIVCNNGVLPQEMSVSDSGAQNGGTGASVTVCEPAPP